MIVPRQWRVIPESWGFNRGKENGGLGNGYKEGTETKMMERVEASFLCNSTISSDGMGSTNYMGFCSISLSN